MKIPEELLAKARNKYARSCGCKHWNGLLRALADGSKRGLKTSPGSHFDLLTRNSFRKKSPSCFSLFDEHDDCGPVWFVVPDDPGHMVLVTQNLTCERFRLGVIETSVFRIEEDIEEAYIVILNEIESKLDCYVC